MKTSVAYLLLTLPPLMFFVWPALVDDVFFHEDISYYFYSLRSRLYLGLSQWSPWTGMGMPLLADGQLGAFFPLNLPYYFLPTSLALLLSTGLSFVICSYLMVRWLRLLGVGLLPAAAGAFIFVWTGFFWQHLHHVTFIGSGMWLPAFFIGVHHILEGQRRGIFELALATCLSLLAGGSPQLVLYGLYACFFYALVSSLGQKVGFSSVLLHGLKVCAGILWGVAGAAVALLPFVLAVNERFVDSMGAYDRSALFSVHPLALIRLLVPNILGNPFYDGAYRGFSAYWEEGSSVALMTLLLLPLGARLGGLKGWKQPYFVGLLSLSFLGMLGTLGAVHPVLYNILPGYGLFRAPGRLYLLFTFAAAVLASLALQRLMVGLSEEQLSRWQKDRKVLLVIALELMVLGAIYVFMAKAGSVAVWGLALAFAVLIVGEFAIRRSLLSPRFRPMLPIVICLLLLVEVLPLALSFNHTFPIESAETPSSAEAFLAKRQLGKSSRVLVDDSIPPRYLNAGMDVGYLGIRAYNPLNSERIHRMVSGSGEAGGILLKAEDYQAPVFDLMAAELYLSKKDPVSFPHYERIFHDEMSSISFYENPNSLPRLYFPGPVWIETEESAFAQKVKDAALLRPPPLVMAFSPTEALGDVVLEGAKGRLSTFVESADRLHASLELQSPGFVVLADTYAPGWTATTNGIPASIFPAYGGLRAIYVDQIGSVELEMRYETPGLKVGGIISFLALMALLGTAFLGRNVDTSPAL